ncbi:MAG: phosphatidylglycerophosphatase A [Desulfatirhabdiaceae bacterium]
MSIPNRVILFLATGCHSGYFPVASGTAGSVVGLFPAFFLSTINLGAATVVCAIFMLAAVWIADQAEKIIRKKDSGLIVIDEIAGMMVTLLGLPFTLPMTLAGFFLFRVMDILKPFPINYLERKVPGGAGVVIDDVVAGIFCNILLRIAWMIV